MRKVTRNAVNAFNRFESGNFGNTTVIANGAKCGMYLHGNLIAERDKLTGEIEVRNAGWFTVTTQNRLNSIDCVSVCIKKGVWYLNGVEWDGSPKIINP